MSSLQETKLIIEELFKTNWTDTPIHFSGQEFDARKMPQWINLIIRPSRITRASVSNGRSIMSLDVYVPCWSDTEAESFELADKIIAFFNSKVGSSAIKILMPNSIDSVTIIDQGWNEANKSFVVPMFSMTVQVGNC